MKILDSTKTLTQLSTDATNGIGQINPLSCIVTEVLNGEYEAELTLSVNDKYFSSLSVGSLLEIELDAVRGKQIFEVYFIGKPINEIATIKCQHISYRLGKTPVSTFSSTGAVSTVNNLLSHVIGTIEFTMTTDITNTTSNFSLGIPRYFRECLGGYEGSLLDVFRGEYEWDNLTVKMLARRGADNGVRIAYGKNLTDFNQEENNQNVYTSVLGYAVVDDVTYTGNVYDKIVSSNKRVKIVDFSNNFQSGDTPTANDLDTLAQTYATNNDIENPNVNITISFVPLYQTEEYKNIAPLERVNLGDTVHVYFEKMGVEASSRVVKTAWNVLTKKYDSVELGSVKANLNTVLNEVSESILSDVGQENGFLTAELQQMGSLIINGLGLFKTTETLADGSVRIYLHNKPELANSDIQYYISASGLVVSTDYGSTWNAGFNPDGSAVLNALSANIIRALQIYGSFLRFGDVNSNYIDVAPYSENNTPQGVSFDGTGSIRMQLTGKFDVQNYDNNSVYNQLLLEKRGTGNYISISNIEYQTSNPANRIAMEGVNYNNRIEISNYQIGNTYVGNQILMSNITSENQVHIENYKKNSSVPANRMVMNLSDGLIIMNNGTTYQNSITMNDADMTIRAGDDLILTALDRCVISCANGRFAVYNQFLKLITKTISGTTINYLGYES